MVVYTVVTSANVTKVDLYELYLFTEDQVPKRLHVLAVCVCVPQLVLETSSFVEALSRSVGARAQQRGHLIL